MKNLAIIFLFCTTLTPNVQGQNAQTDSIQFDLSEMSWLEGSWKGEAFGGVTEEVWSAPSAGSMMCVFKLTINDQIKFYEIVIIRMVEDNPVLQLKHFNEDLIGWEEKNKTVDFQFIKREDNKFIFDGFIFEKVSDKEMNIYVKINSKGKEQLHLFPYTKLVL